MGLVAVMGGGGAAAEDASPTVLAVSPAVEASDVALSAVVTVTFSEPVALTDSALVLVCELSEVLTTTVQGDGQVFTFRPEASFAPGERCEARLHAEAVADQDADDPPDRMMADFSWSFHTIQPPILINEVDPVTSADTAEFVELFDGGVGHTSLTGLTLVFYRGDKDTVYLALDLGGYETDSRGYFVVGGESTNPDLQLAVGSLRDGPDAVALYDAPRSDFPVGRAIATDDLIDAVVYTPAGAADEGLAALLLPDRPPLDEDQRGAAAADSLQRYPNGRGAARDTAAYIVSLATPDAANQRLNDDAPRVTSVWPAAGATIADVAVILEVTFSEIVALHDHSVEIVCSLSGEHTYALNGNGQTFHFRPYLPLVRGENCTITVIADRLNDEDVNDPPDIMAANYSWSFATAPSVAETVLINEIDADTAESDRAEFIELYDGGAGLTALDGLLVVLFNGGDDRSYRTIDLAGHTTDGAGYFLLGNADIVGVDLVLPNGALQNGTDAVALLDGHATDYPNGTPVAGVVPLDAIVYGPVQPADAGLLLLLNAGQMAVDENDRGEIETHSSQRCPNGAGGARNTAGFRQNTPTPRAASNCATDTAPTVTERSPAPGAVAGVAAAVGVAFSEPVAVSGGWLTITCTQSGTHAYTTAGGPINFVLQPAVPFSNDESCTTTIKAQRVRDLDSDDPPDNLASSVTWQFTTTDAPPDFLLINEIDPDTPGSDTAEFIELFDGGRGATPLDGLVLVFYNGYTNTAYRALDLDGQLTDATGYWLAGNSALSPDLVFATSGLQNGPDAVALYAGDATQFPTDSPLRTDALLDAIVYGDADSAAGLLPLLLAGETAVDEGARGAARHALQRCPNGGGGQRRSGAFRPNAPTPGAISQCTIDTAPAILGATPAGGATHVAVDVSLTVEFSEPMATDAGWLRLVCAGSERALTIVPDGATAYTATPNSPLLYNTLCLATINVDLLHDADSDDPPDRPASDLSWSFMTMAPVADNVLINELDSDTPGNDTAEFIELTDGGAVDTDLSGLVLVLFNGKDDRAYYAVDLDGLRTDSDGFAVIGSAGLDGAADLPTAVIQNGADAVALYEGDAADFPNGTQVTTNNLRDAIVYGTADPADAGLLPLLAAGEGQFDEAARGTADLDSSQRCPDGGGGSRRTTAYRANQPTPGAPNDCATDIAPAIIIVTPPDGAIGVAAGATLAVQFSEVVVLDDNWFAITCTQSGNHAAATSGGPANFTLLPTSPFASDETCTAMVYAARIHDADAGDPPDSLAADFAWSFRIAAGPPAPEDILINELDSDTPGSDAAEFVELFDGGRGHIGLSGLVVVLWNGRDDTVYAVIDLTGQATDENGYFVIGRAGQSDVDLILPAAGLQNGPDAVALYAGRASDFPNGAPLTTNGLLDAIVYGPSDASEVGLLPLLENGQAQVDEGEQADATAHSLQRCPNGQGGPRRTATYRAAAPTPGQANHCIFDDPPGVLAVLPLPGSTGIDPAATLTITFSEPVELSAGWIVLVCNGVEQAVTTLPGDSTATVIPGEPLPTNAMCDATIRAAAVSDRDTDDPPDHPEADTTWRFTTASAPPPLIPSFVTNSPVWIDTPVVFTNTTTGSEGLIFVWAFGDGTGSTAAHPNHRYAAAGTYTVTLTATSGTVSASVSAQIVVRARASYVPLVVGLVRAP